MTRTSRENLESRSFELMAIIERETDRRTRAACIANNVFAEKLGVSENCVRFTLRRLLERGWIAKCERFLPNGGQIENAYILSPRGRAKLKGHFAKVQERKDAQVVAAGKL